MATFRRVGDKWRAEVRIKGKAKSKRFPASGRSKTPPREAQEWAAQVEAQMRGSPDVDAGRTLGMAFRRYAEEVSPTKKGERWEITRLNKLGRDPLANIPLSVLSLDDLNEWRNRELARVKGSTVSREMTLIMSVVRKCIEPEWRWLDRYPFDGANRPKEPPPRKRRVSDGEVMAICEAVGMTPEHPRTQQIVQRVVIAFMIAIETGMRLGELCSLAPGDVSLHGRSAHLADSKNDDARDVPLSSRACELFGLLLANPVSKTKVIGTSSGSASTAFRKARDAAGIDGLHFHDSRHEACTRLARKIDVLDLARMIGHRDINSLLIYYNPTAKELAERIG